MKLLAIRFSALGDVAMTVPVIDSLARRYPQHDFVFVSRPFVAPLFGRMPSNVRFIGVDVKQYPGLQGLYRLFKVLKKEAPDAVADLHDVLRTKVLRTFFRLGGVRTASIDKGRKEKKELTRPHKGIPNPLKTSFERYEDVFRRLGLEVETTFRSIFEDEAADVSPLIPLTGTKGADRWIGIAPFAAHRGKILPERIMEELIGLLSSMTGYKVFLFGGGKAEKEKLEAWEKRYPQTVSLAGKLKMTEELALMSRLDAMVSMDSANMHLASLVGTPVISVWGATHPAAGFMGWGQSEENAVQLDLECRPCSIYGNKPCRRGDYACLESIQAVDILNKIKRVSNDESKE